MKRLIKKSTSPVEAATNVNPVSNGVCHITDVDAFDFDDFDDTLDYRFDSYEDYRAWMERYFES